VKSYVNSALAFSAPRSWLSSSISLAWLSSGRFPFSLSKCRCIGVAAVCSVRGFTRSIFDEGTLARPPVPVALLSIFPPLYSRPRACTFCITPQMNPISILAIALFLALFAQPAEGQYYMGSRGGCYTLTRSGNKRYVDRSMCTGGSKPMTAVRSRQPAAVPAVAAVAPIPVAPAVTFVAALAPVPVVTPVPTADPVPLFPPAATVPTVVALAAANVLAAAPPPRAPQSPSRYYLGPRGGCYTLTASGNKRYVDRSMCQ